MARKSTIALAEKALTPDQFKNWQAMPVKLSKKQLLAGELPPESDPTADSLIVKGPDESIVHSLATKQQIQNARAGYADEEIRIDDDALASASDGGVWVQAWVWLEKGVDYGEDDSDSETEA